MKDVVHWFRVEGSAPGSPPRYRSMCSVTGGGTVEGVVPSGADLSSEESMIAVGISCDACLCRYRAACERRELPPSRTIAVSISQRELSRTRARAVMRAIAAVPADRSSTPVSSCEPCRRWYGDEIAEWVGQIGGACASGLPSSPHRVHLLAKEGDITRCGMPTAIAIAVTDTVRESTCMRCVLMSRPSQPIST